MTLSYRGKFYVYLGAAICCVGILLFLSWFLFGMITEAGARIMDAKREVRSLAVKQEQMGAITKEYETVRNLLPALDDMLLSRAEKLRFIMLVEDLASRAGVHHVIEAADDAAPAKKDAPAPPTTFFNITVYGSFPNTLKFLYLLESAEIYLSADKLQITHAGGGVVAKGMNESFPLAKDDVKMQLSVKAYTR